MQWSLFLLILMGQCSCFTCQLYVYHFISEDKSWIDAQTYCKDHYTDLATVPKMKYMERLLQFEPDHEKAWIVLHNVSGYPEQDPQYCYFIKLKESRKHVIDSCDKRKPFFCYYDKVVLIKEEKTWEDALEYCRVNYRDLVSITEPDEQIWVQHIPEMASSSYVWLGLRYSCPLDLWFWVSDELVCYENWASEGHTDEECDVAVAMGPDGRWYKKNENDKLHFFCSSW